MNRHKLASFLAVTLSLELMLAPIIPHVHAQSDNSKQDAKAKEAKRNNSAQSVNAGLQAIGQIWGAASGMNNPNSGMTPQMANDMQMLTGQRSLQPDKYFNPQKLSRIPGLANYMALNNINPNMLNCPTLPTTLHEANPEVCRLGITTDKGVSQQFQINQMFTYHNQYFQISKMYKNFSADSNTDGQAFGIGCMNNAMNILNGFFKYRVDELDKLTTNLEAMQNKFREASRSDLDAIEEAVAVLDGNSPIADKVRGKKPELFDFAKRFNNPACKSMFVGEGINNLGRNGGLNAINADIRGKFTEKKGKYSGESYTQSHASVIEDINSVAEKISKQVELNFSSTANNPKAYFEFLNDVKSQVSSGSRVQDSINAEVFTDVQTKYSEKFSKFSENRSLIQSEIPSSSKALALIGSINSGSFEAEVNTLENNIKNNCLNDALARKRIQDKIYDPTSSSHAGKYAANPLKAELDRILDNPSTSIEKKLADLRAAEAEQGNRYYIHIESSYTVQELDANGNIVSRLVDASAVRAPSVYFSDLVKNCNAQFKVNKLNNKLSGAAAVQKLRELNQDFKNFAKSQAAEVKKDIRKKLIECSSPEVANNTIPGSCGPDLFNPSTAGFCANAAFSCSKNMQACNKQAEGYVKEIKDQKTARVNNYKALVEKNKQDIVKIFDSALARYMKDGEALRGLFGAGFSSPIGIKREVFPESDRYLSEFERSTGKMGSPDGKLLLEDPDKYVALFKENIVKLKESVVNQQKQILGGSEVGTGKNPGLLADHIEKTKKNYEIVHRQADKIAENCINQHDGAVKMAEAARAKQAEEAQKLNSELGEKLPRFCRAFETGRVNPGPACNGNFEDLVISAMKAAHKGGNVVRDQDAVSEFEEVCNSTTGSSRDGSYDPGEQRASTNHMCKLLEGNSDCAKLVGLSCETTTVIVNGQTQIVDPCARYTKEITLEYNRLYSAGIGQDGPRKVTSAAPSFCSAAHSDNRESGKSSTFQNFADGLAKGLGAGSM
jgi:hypothetical protein